MANLTYTLNGIQFTDIKVPMHLSGGVVSKAKYTSGGTNASTLKGGEIDGIFQTLNAIDIDWNGAQLKNDSTVKATLNTTGDMLSILQTAYNYATTYTGKTSLTSSSELGKINGQSLKYGGSINIEVGNDYTLPGATKTTLGGIKSYYHTTGDAPIVDTSKLTKTDRHYGVETDGSYVAFVKVPWTDTTITVSDLSTQGNVLFLTGIATRDNHNAPLTSLNTYNIGITTAGYLVKFSPDSVSASYYKAFIHTINGQPSKNGEFIINNVQSSDTANTANIANTAIAAGKVNNTLTVQFNGTSKATFNGSAAATVNITPGAIGAAVVNHNHIGTSNYGNTINAKNQNLTYFDNGWYRIGYFGWQDANNVTGSHNLMFNISSDGNYRSSSICGSIIQGASTNYNIPQAKINIINASKFTESSKPVFDGIRTVKELILPEINAAASLKETHSTYGHPAQVTYVDLHIAQDTDESKQLQALANNFSYMFSGNNGFVYDNKLLKVPTFSSSFESIKSKDGAKTAYIRRTITYKPIEYTTNDNTTYLYFIGESSNGIYSYNTSSNPVRVGSSALIKPSASEAIIYSIKNEDKEYITISKQNADKSVTITPLDTVTASKEVTIYCTTALGSIVKQIKVWVDKADDAINSVEISNTDPISTSTDRGLYKATVNTSGTVSGLSYQWVIMNGAPYVTIVSPTTSETVTVEARNTTKVIRSYTIRCTVSSTTTGVTEKYGETTIDIPAAVTTGNIFSINNDDNSIGYGASVQLNLVNVSSTAWNSGSTDAVKSYSWSVANTNTLRLSSSTAASPTITNINTTGAETSNKVECTITFESGLTHTTSIVIKVKKQELKYYWYVGQDSADNLITTDNYTDYCQSVTNYQSSQTFTVNDKYLYLVVLASKTVEALDSSNGPLNFKYYNETANAFRNAQTTVTLDDGNEYIIYRSAATANDTYTITIK